MKIRGFLVSVLAAVTVGSGVPANASGSADVGEQPVLEHTSRAATPQTKLRRTVHAYSEAFLGGHPQKAYALLAPRCRDAIAYNDFAEIVYTAHEIYGQLPIRSYRAHIKGKKARVTYRYDVRPLDQVREPWVRRAGGWRNNEC